MIQLLSPLGQEIGSAWTVLAAMPQITRARASGFRADIANLLFQPKEIAVMTIPAATSDLCSSPKPGR
jgi:hypothetical protein